MRVIKKRKGSSSIGIRSILTRKKFIAFIAIFGVFGLILMVISKAASPFVALEVETSTLSAPAITGSDSTASGNSYVQFRAAGSGDPLDSCGYNAAARSCWNRYTGVTNPYTSDPYDRWSYAQLTAGINATPDSTGHRPTDYMQTVGAVGAEQRVLLNQNGQVYENKIVYGCIDVQADNVTIRNVFVKWDAYYSNMGNLCHSGVGGGLISTGWQVPGHDWTGTLLQNVEYDAGATQQGSGFCCQNVTMDHVNAHGGFTTMRINAGLTMHYSYIHDVTSNHLPGCTGINGGSSACPDDLHRDLIWAQGSHDLYIDHSYFYNSDVQNYQGIPYTLETANMLMDRSGQYNLNFHNAVFDTVYIDGGGGVGITGQQGTAQRTVWRHMFFDGEHHTLGAPYISQFLGGPCTASDYSPGDYTGGAKPPPRSYFYDVNIVDDTHNRNPDTISC